MLILTSSKTAQLTSKHVRFFASQKSSRLALKKFYQTLGVEENCTDEVLRLSFVNLAKRFHPDSGSNEASTDRFSEIENAYRQIQRQRFEEREKGSDDNNPEVEEYDIKHTAPQHRHYLVNDVGLGTPSARQRRHAAERARRALENVLEHRLEKIQADERATLVGQDKRRARDVKTRLGMDRLVEDLIQEAMSRGEFSDLPGTGKPLKENINRQNPYVDFVTHKLNQVLIDNGFTPEWIQLSKEIREDTNEVKQILREARNRLGNVPLNPEDQYHWNNTLENLTDRIKKLNNKIDKYNLLVPILQKQVLQVSLASLADEALAVPPDKTKLNKTKPPSKTAEEGNLMQFITSVFESSIIPLKGTIFL